MKKTLVCAVAATFALLISACGSSRDPEDVFDHPLTLQADSLPIGQILSPSRWAVSNGKAVVQSRATDSLFYVYSLPDFRFLYTWGRRGNGPGEFTSAVTIATARDGDTGELWLQDYGTQKLLGISTGDLSIYRRDTCSTHPDKKNHSDDRPLPGGFIGTKKIPADQQTEYFYVRSARDGSVLDSVALATHAEVRRDEKGNIYSLSRFCSPRVIARKDRVALVYELFRHVDVYRISPQGKLSLVASTGETMDPATIERMMADRRSELQKGITGFMATDRYIYTLYIEFQVLDWDTRQADIFRRTVYAYDWDGQPAFAYELDKPVSALLVDADDRYLYTYNELTDFEQVYRYPLPR